MAAALLLVVVLAVTTAVTAAQHNAMEAEQRVAGMLVAEDLMGWLMTRAYGELPAWNGHHEPVGTIVGMDGSSAPASVGMVGRRVTVAGQMHSIDALSVRVRGLNLCVVAFDEREHVLCRIETFVPEPPE